MLGCVVPPPGYLGSSCNLALTIFVGLCRSAWRSVLTHFILTRQMTSGGRFMPPSPCYNERPRSMPLLRKLFYCRARACLSPPQRSRSLPLRRLLVLVGWQNLQNSLSPSALSLFPGGPRYPERQKALWPPPTRLQHHNNLLPRHPNPVHSKYSPSIFAHFIAPRSKLHRVRKRQSKVALHALLSLHACSGLQLHPIHRDICTFPMPRLRSLPIISIDTHIHLPPRTDQVWRSCAPEVDE